MDNTSTIHDNVLNNRFMAYYNETVKPLAIKCAVGFETMMAIENGATFADDSPEIIQIKSLRDALAAWYVGLFMNDVVRAQLSGVRLNTINSISTIYGTLNSESYWTNVWENDLSSDEAKNLRALGDAMQILINKL